MLAVPLLISIRDRQLGGVIPEVGAHLIEHILLAFIMENRRDCASLLHALAEQRFGNVLILESVITEGAAYILMKNVVILLGRAKIREQIRANTSRKYTDRGKSLRECQADFQ